MALTPGSRLGVYEVIAPIGEGGMGQVFRARDTKLNRDVALKVLPDSFATDRDRLARFTREAQTLASLNHPHIAAIYGLEESGSTHALVMELVAGEDLSRRIARGALPCADALVIASQIADALDAAHEQGIVHRDLKPANIKVRDDGTVKVLDFGLAKGLGSETAGSTDADQLNAPTLTSSGTALGMVLGTARYMSPEHLTRGSTARLSPAASGINFGTWNASGDRVVFRLFNTPVWTPADGSGNARPVPGAYVNNYPASPGPDPDSVFVVRIVQGGSADISLVSMSGAFEPKSVVATPGYDGGPTLSPNGRWLLFISTMSGLPEAYVKPYPALDRQWQVTAGGGTQVRWSRDGREIYYRADQHFVSVPFNASGAEPVIGKPKVLFADVYDFGTGITIPNYDVTPDGRFILTKRETGDGGLQIGMNWTNELTRILAAGGVR